MTADQPRGRRAFDRDLAGDRDLRRAVVAQRVAARPAACSTRFTYSRIVLPEVVFALGLLVLFSKLHIAFGVRAIVLGHVVFNSAYATVIIQARLAGLSSSLEEAAADLGANRWRVFKRVTLPLLLPAVLVAGLLCISFSFDDVIVSQFLGGNNAEPVSVLLLGMIHLHVTPEVNAIGSALMLITLIIVRDRRPDHGDAPHRRRTDAWIWQASRHVTERPTQPVVSERADWGSRAPASEPTPAVRLTGLRRTYGDVQAVDGIDLEIGDGEFFSMIGPSGCGKTTTLRMIAGLVEPSEGRIEVHGRDVTDGAPASPPGQHRVSELRAVPAPERV